MNKPKIPTLRERIMSMLWMVLIALGLVVALLYVFQERMIYYPRSYPMGYENMLPDNTRELNYEITINNTDYPQTSFYIPPEAYVDEPPPALVVVFGGNATVALDWLDIVTRMSGTDIGFLLIDYPGYGKSRGSPSPESIDEASHQAYRTMMGLYGGEDAFEKTRVGVMGHSLGCAATMLFSTRHQVDAIFLNSPFTSTFEMARKMVGWPLCHLLRHRYDNRARLKEVLESEEVPYIVIVGGGRDTIIPMSMGQELAAMSPDISYHEYPDADHVSIINEAESVLEEFFQELLED